MHITKLNDGVAYFPHFNYKLEISMDHSLYIYYICILLFAIHKLNFSLRFMYLNIKNQSCSWHCIFIISDVETNLVNLILLIEVCVPRPVIAILRKT